MPGKTVSGDLSGFVIHVGAEILVHMINHRHHVVRKTAELFQQSSNSFAMLVQVIRLNERKVTESSLNVGPTGNTM